MKQSRVPTSRQIIKFHLENLRYKVATGRSRHATITKFVTVAIIVLGLLTLMGHEGCVKETHIPKEQASTK